MRKEEIVVTIDKGGKTEMDLNGFKDSSCLAETEAIKKALDAKVITSNKKPEAYQKETKQKYGAKIGK